MVAFLLAWDPIHHSFCTPGAKDFIGFGFAEVGALPPSSAVP